MPLNKFNDIELMSLNTLPTPVRQKLDAMVDAINSTEIQKSKAMSGDIVFKCTPATLDTTVANQNMGAGVGQVETITPVVTNTTIKTAGTARVVISSSEHADIEVVFSVALNDSQANVVTKAKTALNVAKVTDLYTIGGSSSTITFTKKVKTVNDVNLQAKIQPVTCGEELSTTTSVNTTAGSLPYIRNVVVTLESADGELHNWFNGVVPVTLTKSSAGSTATATLNPVMVNGSMTIPITFSGTFSANDTNTLNVTQRTVLGYTVTAKTSIETSLA
jgi:hypothetical protein